MEGTGDMSLSDRLAEARRARSADQSVEPRGGDLAAGLARARRSVDPFAELKRTVHQTLLESIGPQLYDARLTQSELEQRVRITLSEVLAADDTPLTVSDRARIAQDIADDILGYGPIEPYLRDPDITEVMVNGPDSIYVERGGRIFRGDAPFSDEAPLPRTVR